MYKRNELYRKITDKAITPEQLVDIILSLQEENKRIQEGLYTRDIENEIKNKDNCQLVVLHKDNAVKEFSISLRTIPSVDDKLLLNINGERVLFQVVDVVKDITVKRRSVTEKDIIYVKILGGD